MSLRVAVLSLPEVRCRGMPNKRWETIVAIIGLIATIGSFVVALVQLLITR